MDTTAAIVAQHTPSADNALEAEVAELLKAAGAQQAEAMQEAEEALALKVRTDTGVPGGSASMSGKGNVSTAD